MSRIRELEDEISQIGRYMGSISPKLSKYAELSKRKDKLKAELKSLGGKLSGTQPKLRNIDPRKPARSVL